MANGYHALAEAINGYIRGTQIRRGMDREDEERAFREEERNYRREDRARDNEERTALRQAYAPVEVQEGAGGALKPDTMDNRDVGLPGEQAPVAGGYRVAGRDFGDRAAADAAAAASNTREAQDQRAADAYRRIGKPAQASQLESAQIQAKAAKFTLDKGQQEWVDKQFDKRLASIGDADQLAGVLNGSPVVQGRKVTAAPSADGKTVDLIAHNDDGSTVKLNNKPIENSAQGLKKAITTFSQSMDPMQKITALQHFETFDETVRHNQATEGQAAAQLAETGRHNRAAEGISQASLGVSQGHLKLAQDKQAADLKNNPDYVLPAAVKLSVQAQDRTIAGLEKAINDAEAGVMADPKGISMLRARLAKAQEARDGLIQPYMPKGAGAPAAPAGQTDYMGYRGGAQGAPGAPSKPALTMPARNPAPVQQPTAASGAAPAGALPPDSPQGQALDTARSTLEQARAAVQRYGLRQQQQDPQGYQAALAAVEQAKVVLTQAEQDYQASIDPRMRQAAFGR